MTTSHAWPYADIAALAGRRQTIITHHELESLGVSRRAIARALARGVLWQVHRGVYSIVPESARPPPAAERAALLAAGPGAVLSHRSAAGLYGFRLRPGPRIELTICVGDRRRPGLVIHRTTDLPRSDRARRGGLAVTGVARTVIDLAPTLSPRALEHLLDEALKLTSRTRFAESLARRDGRPGVARLRGLLELERPSSDTWSIAEERLLRLLRRAGLPAPEVNVALGEYVPDLMWREQRVIVEFDSDAHHSGSLARARDARRHNELTAAGWQVLHVTWSELTNHPERVLVTVATALAGRS